jgi:hypothetical protein
MKHIWFGVPVKLSFLKGFEEYNILESHSGPGL